MNDTQEVHDEGVLDAEQATSSDFIVVGQVVGIVAAVFVTSVIVVLTMQLMVISILPIGLVFWVVGMIIGNTTPTARSHARTALALAVPSVVVAALIPVWTVKLILLFLIYTEVPEWPGSHLIESRMRIVDWESERSFVRTYAASGNRDEIMKYMFDGFLEEGWTSRPRTLSPGTYRARFSRPGFSFGVEVYENEMIQLGGHMKGFI